MMLLSDNGISRVWHEGEWVYKRQPKFMTDNEIWCLQTLYPSGYVPYAEQVEKELIRLEYIQRYQVTDPDTLLSHAPRLLAALQEAGIRHGDLTEYALLVAQGDRPYLIDFAESRLACDPRPDKRPEGDEYWLDQTLRKLCVIPAHLSSG